MIRWRSSSRSRMPVLAMADWAAWRRASSIRWRRLAFPAWAPACATNTASSSRPIRDGWQDEQPDHWLAPARPVGGRPSERNGRGAARLLLRRPRRRACGSSPAGLDADRHAVRPSGGRLRRQDHQHAAPLGCGDAATYFDFQQFSSGDFVGALAETLTAETITRVLYPDDSTQPGQRAALSAGVFPRRLHAGRRSFAASARRATIGTRCRTRSPCSSTTRTRRSPCPS